MSGSLKERLDWLEKNDPVFRVEKKAVMDTIKEMKLKNEPENNKKTKSIIPVKK
jgi:hypothetical protein